MPVEDKNLTRKHFSRIRTTRSNRMVQCNIVQCQWGWVDPDVNNFEQIFSGGHQISLAGVGSEGVMSGGLGTRGSPILISRSGKGLGGMYSEVQCIMLMVKWGSSPVNRQTDRHECIKWIHLIRVRKYEKLTCNFLNVFMLKKIRILTPLKGTINIMSSSLRPENICQRSVLSFK